jgi:hypothetical protein
MYIKKVVIKRLATEVCHGVVPLLVIVDDEERPTHAAGVRQQPELALPDIPDDRNLVRDQALTPELPQLQDEIVRVLVDAHPVAVEEDLSRQPNNHRRGAARMMNDQRQFYKDIARAKGFA